MTGFLAASHAPFQLAGTLTIIYDSFDASPGCIRPQCDKETTVIVLSPMPSSRISVLTVSVVFTVTFLFADPRLALAQPAPQPGVRGQLLDKPDPSMKIPQFEIISVKANKESNRTGVQFTPDGMRGTAVTVQFLLYEGYGGINQNQVIGEPSWSTTDGFDIQAKVADADVPTLAKLTFEQRRTMFQQILTDRFKMVAHHETRELPIYVLTVAKGGSKLKASAPDDSAATTPRRRSLMGRPGGITATGVQLSMLIPLLSRQLGRPIIDKTGLTGNYDYTLDYTNDRGTLPPPAGGAPPTPPAAPPPPEQPGPDIFTALQEQLGLKLESSKGPVDVIVIDHIERPSQN